MPSCQRILDIGNVPSGRGQRIFTFVCIHCIDLKFYGFNQILIPNSIWFALCLLQFSALALTFLSDVATATHAGVYHCDPVHKSTVITTVSQKAKNFSLSRYIAFSPSWTGNVFIEFLVVNWVYGYKLSLLL